MALGWNNAADVWAQERQRQAELEAQQREAMQPPVPPAMREMLPQGGVGPDIGRALLAALQQMGPVSGRGRVPQAIMRGFAQGFGQVQVGKDERAQAENAARMKANEAAQGGYDKEMAGRRQAMLEAGLGKWDRAQGAGGGLTPQQYDKLGVPQEFRSPDGYAAWLKSTSRSDANLNRLQIRAAATKDIAQFPEIRDAYQKVQMSAGGGTGVSDMALVFSFMRILDPTSVVREGEYDRAVKTAAIPDWLWARAQAVTTGAFLSPKQRKQMVDEAGGYYNQKRDAYRRARQWVDRSAKHYGVDASLVLPDLEAPNVYIDVSQNEPGPIGDGEVDQHGIPKPKLKEAGR